MRRKRTIEEINKKCELLSSLGFEIYHNDSHVGKQGVDFDFSATACDHASIMYTALKTMYAQGRKDGRNDLRNDLNNLLEIEE